MEEIIKVNPDTQTVSARDLHEQLGIARKFSIWFETNSQGFIEGEDFTRVRTGTLVNNGAFRELQDYELSLDMAKHICLMSRTDKGKLCRQYLIDLEKAWNSPEQVWARALKMADATIAKLKDQNYVQQARIKEMVPKEIFADAVTASNDTILIRDLAKLIKQNGVDMGEKKLFQWLRDNGYLIRGNSADHNMPTQKSMELKLFEIHERTITPPDQSPMITKTVKVTGKGQNYFINKFMMA